MNSSDLGIKRPRLEDTAGDRLAYMAPKRSIGHKASTALPMI